MALPHRETLERAAQPGLKQDLGLWSAVAIVIGTVIGSGIFLVPRAMVSEVGSVHAVFVVWVVGGLLSLFGALSYAELGAALPEAGGEYVYLREAYGPFWSFLYGWTQISIAKSGSIATLATAFFYYLANFRPELEQVFGTIPMPLGKPLEIRYGQILGMALILFLAGVNYFGVKLGGRIQVGVTALKIALILAIIGIGVGSSVGTFRNFSTSIPSVTGGAGAFVAALVAALWAYDGWNHLGMVASEVRDPRRNVPLALIWGTAAVMAIYLLANVAYFYVLSAQEVAASNRVAAAMMQRIVGPRGAGAVSIAAMISIFAALNGSILSGARVPYAMARDGYFFSAFARVHPLYHSPGVSTLFLGAWSAVLMLSGRYEQLFTYVIFANWILYGMTTAAVLVLRRKQPGLKRPYRTLGYPVVPVLFVLAASWIVLSTLIHSPRESGFGLALILIGLPLYIHWKKKHFRQNSGTPGDPRPV